MAPPKNLGRWKFYKFSHVQLRGDATIRETNGEATLRKLVVQSSKSCSVKLYFSLISTKPTGGRAWRDFKTEQQISLEVGKKRQEAVWTNILRSIKEFLCSTGNAMEDVVLVVTWNRVKRVTKLLSLKRMMQDRKPCLIFRLEETKLTCMATKAWSLVSRSVSVLSN